MHQSPHTLLRRQVTHDCEIVSLFGPLLTMAGATPKRESCVRASVGQEEVEGEGEEKKGKKKERERARDLDDAGDGSILWVDADAA